MSLKLSRQFARYFFNEDLAIHFIYFNDEIKIKSIPNPFINFNNDIKIKPFKINFISTS